MRNMHDGSGDLTLIHNHCVRYVAMHQNPGAPRRNDRVFGPGDFWRVSHECTDDQEPVGV